MPKAVEDHIHKLRRHTYANGSRVYFCTNNCTFKVEVPFALGLRVLCNTCGEPFTMNEYAIKLAKPHCNNCGKMKVNIDGVEKFVPKGRASQAIAELGASSATALKDRMSKVVTMEPVIDEDI
jgi:hypothetical protein